MHLELLADRPQDVPVIARWCFDEWGHAIPGNTFEQTCERINQKLNRHAAPLHVLAIEGGRPIGTAQLKIRELDLCDAWEYWLGDVYVLPAHRGHGVASAICRRVQAIAAALGIHRLYLQTERPGGGLYSRLGWRAVKQIERDGKPIVIMELELEQLWAVPR